MTRARERAESAIATLSAVEAWQPSTVIDRLESAGLVVVDREQLSRVLRMSRRQTQEARANFADQFQAVVDMTRTALDAYDLARDIREKRDRIIAGLRKAVVVLAEHRAQGECDDTDYDGPAYSAWLWLRRKADAIRAEARARRMQEPTP